MRLNTSTAVTQIQISILTQIQIQIQIQIYVISMWSPHLIYHYTVKIEQMQITLMLERKQFGLNKDHNHIKYISAVQFYWPSFVWHPR